MRKLGFIKKLGFIIGIIVLLMAVMPMSDGLAVQAQPLLEYGDANDPTYPSKLASNGARHPITETECLGLNSLGDWKDWEPDAWVPDMDMFDDGLNTFFIGAGNPAATVTFEASNLGGPNNLIVNILIDLNRDGDWLDNVGGQSEHVVQNQALNLPAVNDDTFVSNSFSTVGATPGPTWLRLTLTRTPVMQGWYGEGLFDCGETEDWQIWIEEGEDWYYKPGGWEDYALSGMPDFDQKQDAWTNPSTGNWSYCGPTAVANSMWYFDSREEPSPVPPPTVNDNYPMVTSYGAWDDHDPLNVEPLVNDLAYLMDTDGQRTGLPKNGTDVYDMQWGIDQFLVNAGLYGYYYELTKLRPGFGWIEAEVERCEDVILLLGFWQEQPTGGWLRIGGHYVTCAGVNSYDWQLAISDPMFDNAEKTGIGRVLPPVPPHPAYPHNATVHNDTWYVSHDVYNVTQSGCPGGPWALEDYALGKNITNFTGQNSGFDFAGYEGEYGETGFPVVTQIDYAVAVSPKPDLNDVIDSSYKWAEDGENVSVRVHVTDEAWNNTIWDVEICFWTEEIGSEYLYWEIFQSPLQYCQNYTFNVTWDRTFLPEIVVVHFTDFDHYNIGFAFSDPVWYYKPGGWEDYALSGMPDFDQKQDNWTDNGIPTGDWTHCGPVAVANSLWYFDSREEPSPIPPPTINDNYGLVTAYGPWDDHHTSNVEPLVNDLASLMNTGPTGTDVMDMQRGIDRYLVNRSYYGYYYEKTVKYPDFLWIEEEVERCEDVILLLGFWQETYEPPYFYARIGGHYVTCAGVNSEDWQIAISDPYRDNAEWGFPGRVLPPSPPHPGPGHNATVHNDTWYVSHDTYDVTCGLYGCPGGPCVLEDYVVDGPEILGFIGQNCPEEFIDLQGDWNPMGPPVVTQIEYAVDVSPKADLNDVIESDYNLTETNVTIRVHVTNETWNNTIWDMDVLLWNSTNGTQVPWPHWDFDPPLEFCVDYYFNVSFGSFPPEEVVLHFSNETGDNIGFAFSYPAGAVSTLQGNVTFYRAAAAGDPTWVTPLVVSFFDNSTGNETAWSPKYATTNAYGNFTVAGIAVGTYDIGIKNYTTHSKMVMAKVFTPGGITTASFGTLIEADCDDNDKTDGSDYAKVLNNYNARKVADPTFWNTNELWKADYTRDDKIDGSDYASVLNNYNGRGDIFFYTL